MRLTAISLMIAVQLFAQSRPDAAAGRRDLTVKSMETRPASPPTIPRSYALVVGIAKYQNLSAAQNLQYSERDAESIYSILISPEGGNFRAENVHRLIGAKATLANFKHEVEEWLPSVAKSDDRVLIYFAGHGFVANGRAYMAPYDIRLGSDATVAATGYPMDSLGATFGSKILGKWKVLITDACHSGAINPEEMATINRNLIDFNRSVFVLSASRDREQSYESPDWGGGHGLFTYYVERGLGGAADENGDGIVNADELAEYVRTNVRRESQNRQNPNSERGSFDPQMLLAFVAAGVKPDAPAAPKSGAMIIESNLDGVEVFVDGKSEGVVNKGTPLRLPGMIPGAHTVQGVKMGYEPDGPREETVYPGQESTVSLKIRFVRKRPKAALDELNRGLEFYNKGFEANYRKAATHFQSALELDPQFSQAALYLGRTYNALLDQDQAEKYFRRAIQIDPDYVEARASFGGMLVDKGSTDESIRQLNAALQRDPGNGLAYYLLAVTYRLKDAYPESIAAAREAVRLLPAKAEGHFWLAESLRMSGKLDEASRAYLDYLRLSDFDSKLAGQLNYWALGFLIGHGRKSRASVRDIWKDLRSLAYFGICDCDRQQGRFDEAIAACQKSLGYDQQDVYTHYALGLIYGTKAQKLSSLEPLAAASKHFRAMLQINSEIPEAVNARKMLDSYDQVLRAN
jgi:tetratricopeptide (TPR) repeat protein